MNYSDFSPVPNQWDVYAQQLRDSNQQAAQSANLYNSWAQSNAEDMAYRDQAINYWKQRKLEDAADPSLQWNPNLLAQQQAQNLMDERAYRQGGTLRSPSGQPGMYTTTWNGQEINPAFQNWWNKQTANKGKQAPWDYALPVNQQETATPNFVGLQPLMSQEAPQVINPKTVPSLAEIMKSLKALQYKTADRWPENIWQQGI